MVIKTVKLANLVNFVQSSFETVSHPVVKRRIEDVLRSAPIGYVVGAIKRYLPKVDLNNLFQNESQKSSSTEFSGYATVRHRMQQRQKEYERMGYHQ